MSLLVRRDRVISGASPEVSALADARLPDRLGQPWLEEIPIALEGTPRVGDARRLTRKGFCDSWGRWDPQGRELVRLGRRSLASLWGDPFADYLLQQQPDVFHGSSGGLWLRDDVWRGDAADELVSAEWLAPGMVAWSRDGQRLGFTSVVPHTWNRGTLLITVVELDSRKVTRFGPWAHGSDDVLEWTPSSDGLLFITCDDNGDERARLLDLESETSLPLDVESGVQGFVWSADGRALAVAHRGEHPGLTVYRDDGEMDRFQVGSCWTPVWADADHLIYGTHAEEPSPGDSISVLRLRDRAAVQVLGGDTVTDTVQTSIRISDWRAAKATLPVKWWSQLAIESRAVPAAQVPDPKTLGGDEGPLHVRAELELLFYDDPELYAAHAHLW